MSDYTKAELDKLIDDLELLKGERDLTQGLLQSIDKTIKGVTADLQRVCPHDEQVYMTSVYSNWNDGDDHARYDLHCGVCKKRIATGRDNCGSYGDKFEGHEVQLFTQAFAEDRLFNTDSEERVRNLPRGL